MVVPAFINATGHVGQLQVRVWNFKKFLNFLSTRKFWYIWPFLGECVFTLSLLIFILGHVSTKIVQKID